MFWRRKVQGDRMSQSECTQLGRSDTYMDTFQNHTMFSLDFNMTNAKCQVHDSKTQRVMIYCRSWTKWSPTSSSPLASLYPFAPFGEGHLLHSPLVMDHCLVRLQMHLDLMSLRVCSVLLPLPVSNREGSSLLIDRDRQSESCMNSTRLHNNFSNAHLSLDRWGHWEKAD